MEGQDLIEMGQVVLADVVGEIIQQVSELRDGRRWSKLFALLGTTSTNAPPALMTLFHSIRAFKGFAMCSKQFEDSRKSYRQLRARAARSHRQ